MIGFCLCILCMSWLHLTSPGDVKPYHILFDDEYLRDDHYSAISRNATSNQTLSGRVRLALDTYLHPHYCKSTIPVRNASQPIELRMGVSIRKILEVEEFKQLIKVSIWVYHSWKDEFMMWDPKDYEGVTAMRVRHSLIWVPDVVLYSNGAKDEEPLDYINAVISHDGNVTYMYPAVYHVSCHMNVRYFPFDHQNCDLEFGSWSHDSTSVRIKLKDDHATDTHGYSGNTAWHLRNFTATTYSKSYACCSGLDFQLARFRLSITRYWSIHFFYMFIPITLIQILAVMQFLLPCDSGEKISLGITIYLSMLVYLLMVYELLPSTEYIPLMVEYIVSTLFLVATAQVCSICVLMLYHNGTHDNHNKLPHWARIVFLHKLAGVVCMSRYITSDQEHQRKLSTWQAAVTDILDLEKHLPSGFHNPDVEIPPDGGSAPDDGEKPGPSDQGSKHNLLENVDPSSSMYMSKTDENGQVNSESELRKKRKQKRVSICDMKCESDDKQSRKRSSSDYTNKAFISEMTLPKESSILSQFIQEISENDDDDEDDEQELRAHTIIDIDSKEVPGPATQVETDGHHKASANAKPPRKDSSGHMNKAFDSNIHVPINPSKLSQSSIQENEDEEPGVEAHAPAVDTKKVEEPVLVSIPHILVSAVEVDDASDASSQRSGSSVDKMNISRQRSSYSILDAMDSDNEYELHSDEVVALYTAEKAGTINRQNRNGKDHAKTETNSNMKDPERNDELLAGDLPVPRKKSSFSITSLLSDTQEKPESKTGGTLEDHDRSDTQTKDSLLHQTNVIVPRQKSSFSILDTQENEQHKTDTQTEKPEPTSKHSDGQKSEKQQRRDSSERKNLAFDTISIPRQKSSFSMTSITEKDQDKPQLGQGQKDQSNKQIHDSLPGKNVLDCSMSVPRQKSSFSITNVHQPNEMKGSGLKETTKPENAAPVSSEELHDNSPDANKERRDSSQRKNKAFDSTISLPRQKSKFSITSITEKEKETTQLGQSQKDQLSAPTRDTTPRNNALDSSISVPRQKSSFSITNVHQPNEVKGPGSKETVKSETSTSCHGKEFDDNSSDANKERRDSSQRKNKALDSTASLPRQKSKFSITSIREHVREKAQSNESVPRDPAKGIKVFSSNSSLHKQKRFSTTSFPENDQESEKMQKERRDSSERKNKVFSSTCIIPSHGSALAQTSIQEIPEEEARPEVVKPKEQRVTKRKTGGPRRQTSPERKNTLPKDKSGRDKVQPCKFKDGKRKVNTRARRQKGVNVNQSASGNRNCSQDVFLEDSDDSASEGSCICLESHVCHECEDSNSCNDQDSSFHVDNEVDEGDDVQKFGLYRVLPPGTTFRESLECERCRTQCKPAFMSCTRLAKLCRCQAQKRLDELDYDYLLCCCRCMKDTVTERGWSQILVPIDNTDNLMHRINGQSTVGSSTAEANLNINNRILEQRRATKISRKYEPLSPLESFNKLKFQTTQEQLLFRIYKVLHGFKRRLSDDDSDMEVKCEWQQVAMVLDRFLFFVYMIGAIAIMTRVYLQIPRYGPVESRATLDGQSFGLDAS